MIGLLYNVIMEVRTDIEIQILQVRQFYYDALEYIKAQPVISFELYRKVLVRCMLCDEYLNSYRYKLYKVVIN